MNRNDLLRTSLNGRNLFIPLLHKKVDGIRKAHMGRSLNVYRIYRSGDTLTAGHISRVDLYKFCRNRLLLRL